MTRPLPPTYCITCPQAEGRTEKARAHFAERGLDVTMVRGVYGATWGLRTDWVANVASGYKMTPGHVGLCLSHWMLWQHCFLTGHQEALILEDDCYVGEDFHDAFWQTYDALPADWQLLYVGTVGTDVKERKWVNDRLVIVDQPFGTHCYLVRRSALASLINENQEVRTHVDIQMYENSVRKLRYYVAWPGLADQHSFDGTWPTSL